MFVTVLEKHDKYELRHYPTFKWAAAVQAGKVLKLLYFINSSVLLVQFEAIALIMPIFK